MNKSVRRAVVERSAGLCECCFRWVGDEGHADHFWGRAKAPEYVETIWLLCAACDDNKTHNRPNAKTWVERYMVHSALYGYFESMRRCRMRLEWIAAKGSP